MADTPATPTVRTLWHEIRVMWADKAIMLALWLAPAEHPDTAILARHVHAYLTESLAAQRKRRGV